MERLCVYVCVCVCVREIDNVSSTWMLQFKLKKFHIFFRVNINKINMLIIVV